MSDHKASGAHHPDHPLFAPGLKRRKRAGSADACYWIPPHRLVKAGWSVRSVKLEGGEQEIAERCQQLWAELEAWRTGQPTKIKYTINWLIWRYQTDERSPYHSLKQRTRAGYDQSIKIIDDTVGSFPIDAQIEGGILRPALYGAQLREWHYRWSLPDAQGKPTAPVRAWHAFSMLRILFTYAIECGVPGAKDLRDMAGAIRISSPKAREAAPERDMVLAHVNECVKAGLLSMAITTLAQFEFTERRTHIIGEWERPAGHGWQWRPGWLWTGVSRDWVIQYHQTKVGRVERQFDLHDTPALLELIQRIPEEKRVGPMIVCERTGKPWKERHYAQMFRAIARKVGMPDGIWSMDMRAGAATEIDGLQGVTMKDLQAAGGWSTEAMARRYSRGGVRAAQNVVKLRQQAVNKAGK